MMICFTK